MTNAPATPPNRPAHPNGESELLSSVRLRAARHGKARRDGEPSFAGYLAQVGVLGWTIVLPTLIGMFAGRWLDHRFNTGIFWTAPLLLAGLVLGCWAAWRWMHRP
ncbi:MAG TPA: AtpZ/AtpI family protein [Acetobacteraceae bacterium]|jgi:ATP synthase protein I